MTRLNPQMFSLSTPYYILLLDLLKFGSKNWTLIAEMYYGQKMIHSEARLKKILSIIAFLGLK